MTTGGLQDNQQEFIPGIFDVGRLMDAAAAHPGQREALLAVMDKLCRQALSDLDCALHLWRGAQAAQAAAAVHALRGSVGTLGATVFAATARELEAALKDGQPADALWARARQQLQASVDAAAAWLAPQPRLAATAEAPSHEALARWQALLAAQDIDAVTLYRQMKPGLAALPGLEPSGAAAIEHAMGRLDFTAVLAVLTVLTGLKEQP